MTLEMNRLKSFQIFLGGGDQLTEESARNARKGRADGDSDFKRLEGFFPKVEDWHAGRVLYQVSV